MKLREEIDPIYQWDLSEIYASDEMWLEACEKLSYKSDNFSKYKGKLYDSSETLFEALEFLFSLNNEVSKIYIYAYSLHYQDTKNHKYSDFRMKANDIYTKVMINTSFFKPEILEIGQDRINDFISSNRELELYRHYFNYLFRGEENTLSKEQEEFIAGMSSFTNTPSETYSIINNSEVKFEDALDKHGNKVKISHGEYPKIMESEDRVLRENCYNSYYEYFVSRKKTIGSLHKGMIKTEFFLAKSRNYSSSLEASLHPNNISVEIYDNLVKTVAENRKVLHRYTKIRKKALGVDALKSFDMNVSMVSGVNYEVTYEEAKELIIKSLAPMGRDYVRIAKKILNSKWIDALENENKRSGAFSWGTYGTPPYIMMSYKNNVYSLFTLAHELGHSVHSYLSRKHQPFVYSNYSIFIAEVASTLHEALLMDYLLKTTENKEVKKFLLDYKIKDFVNTFFRQTIFAEFEMKSHSLPESNSAIDDEVLSSLYKELLAKHYGEDLVLDDKIACEWARVPHFFNSFYVYQYATGYAAAMAISKAILGGEEGAVDSFIELLKSGCSDYPVELLRKGGVDMTSPNPIKDAISVFDELLYEFERIA